jgi:hypothetical protein
MDFAAATELSHDIEAAFPALTVAGFRRLRPDSRGDDWALDVINLGSGRMETVDEKDLWRERLTRLAYDEQVSTEGKSAAA